MIKWSSHHEIMSRNSLFFSQCICQISIVLLNTKLLVHIYGLVDWYTWLTNNKNHCQDDTIFEERVPQREPKSHKLKFFSMDTQIYWLFMNDVQTTITQFRMLLRANTWPCRFRMKVSKSPIRINFIKISISNLHEG